MPSVNRFMGEKELPANVLYAAAMERQKNNNSVSRLGESAARVAAAMSRPSSAASTSSGLSGITRNNIKMRWVPKTARKNRRASRKSRKANRKSRKAGRR